MDGQLAAEQFLEQQVLEQFWRKGSRQEVLFSDAGTDMPGKLRRADVADQSR
ncbi:hypothetical protein ACQCSU_20080 [Pseudarthrobacter sp. O4]|uniref:hypothetical protein n=1 Tax=Pseudarthrobacter sp. O4 TaxID=3418417 RepID=UPI003CF62AF7